MYGVVISNSKTFCALIGIQYLLAELYRWMNTSIGNIVTINDRKSMHGAMRPQVSQATRRISTNVRNERFLMPITLDKRKTVDAQLAIAAFRSASQETGQK